MYLNYIQKPENLIGVVEFLDRYHDAFEVAFGTHYHLKPNYVFHDWHMLRIDRVNHIVLLDSDGVSLSAFRPLVTTKDDDVRYFMNYGHNTSHNITEVDEQNFHGYYKFTPDTPITLISIVKDNRVNIYKTTTPTLGGDIICPI